MRLRSQKKTGPLFTQRHTLRTMFRLGTISQMLYEREKFVDEVIAAAKDDRMNTKRAISADIASTQEYKTRTTG